MAKRRRGGLLMFVWTLLRGVNLLRILILNVIFFGVLALVLIALGSRPEPLAPDTVLVLHPRGRLVEQFSISPLERALDTLSGQSVHEVRVRDLVGAIDDAAHDSDIKQILLMPGDLQAGGFAALREVGSALQRFRAHGKKVIAWGGHLDRDQYYLAAHADRVLIDPMGAVVVTGLSSHRLYYKDLLDKLGAHVHLFRVGQYKSAAEPFVLDHASDAAKEADRYWMGGLWQQWVDSVAKLRSLDPAKFGPAIAAWPQTLQTMQGDAAQLAEKLGLVDGLATRSQLVAILRRQGIPAGSQGRGFRHVDMDEYLARVRPAPRDGRHADVAIVVAQGEIKPGNQSPGTIGGASTAALIREARLDPNVRALVLRVDSPGGAVYPAEEIRREVALTRKAGKPVVVSMGDVAASGGYWISMNASRIYAEPGTITGSIGIFGLTVNVPDGLAKIGVHNDGVDVGPLAGAFDMTRPLGPTLAAVVQADVERGYHQFVSRVAKARGLSYAAVDAVAQGRVWTGRQALERGLVDKLGGLHDAVEAAAGMANLGKSYTVGYLHPRVPRWVRLIQRIGGNPMVRAMLGHGIRLPHWMASLVARAAPDMSVLEQAQPGKASIFAYCFCSAPVAR